MDLGYRFMKRYWGQGIATEAGQACLHLGFDVLALPRIIALVLPENKASIRVLEKLAFQYEKDVDEEGQIARYYARENS